MRFSKEQLSVINSQSNRLKVMAGAGSGKTTVVREWCARRPGLNILFLVYARLMADDAVATFPANVTCRTFHSLAVSGLRGRRVGPNGLSMSSLSNILGVSDRDLLKRVLECWSAFVVSDEPWPKSKDVEISSLVGYVWRRIKDDATVPLSFDEALKIFSLDSDLSEFDAIVVDEAQDQNKAKEFIVASYLAYKPEGKVLLIGDSDQQINRWNGAVNALDSDYFRSFDVLWLRESYRFGPEVAEIANTILQCKGGRRGEAIAGLRPATKLFLDVSFDHSPKRNINKLGFRHVAYLSRTIRGCIGLGIDLALSGHKIYWVGGLQSYKLNDLCDLWLLAHGRWSDIKNVSFKARYRTIGEYRARNLYEGGSDWVEKSLKHFDDPVKLLGLLQGCSVDDESKATATVTTVSRCKGFGWDAVYINNDFPDILSPGKDKAQHAEEVNLAYVGVTRAKQALVFADGHLSRVAAIAAGQYRALYG